ncbi:hypothetical protein GCM10009737_27200 [Nocardioides lentus]|uniref:Uncharacterized protein n=1 Tax=Nocardioides lentus TaxID=338077 RepID=A0ABP5AZS7_9ACTN
MSHTRTLRSAVGTVGTVVGDAVSRWAVESQQGARRNAMLASTALASRRREHAEVEDFLASRAPRGAASVERARGEDANRVRDAL